MTEKPNKEDCAAKVEAAFESRMDDIRTLVRYDSRGKEHPQLGNLNEYFLGCDLVEAGTFESQREDYIRLQISWGGPSEEFRVYKNGDVEFWYLDWFDGAPYEVTGQDASIIKDLAEMCVGWTPKQ